MRSLFQKFIQIESLSGILLILSALCAIGLANSAWQDKYQWFLTTPLVLTFASKSLSISFTHFVNDGLMVIFFLIIGLEIKREMLEGNLSELNQILLPLVAALGGIILPAVIFILFNYRDPFTLKGWAIPTATDIAFVLGVLALFASRIPIGLKLFVMAVAIYDDLVAILIIALFYTSHLSGWALLFSGFITLSLILCNRSNIQSLSIYIILGLCLWLLVLRSGVHATLAGVVFAFTIPLKLPNNKHSLLKHLEHKLESWVSYIILPLFAFANAGVNFHHITREDYFSPLTLGIALGLFIGKQIGIYVFAGLTIKLNYANLPKNTTWLQLYGASILCGIGFTMSLFISMLAFGSEHQSIINSRLGILMGSLLSAIGGYLLILFATRSKTSF